MGELDCTTAFTVPDLIFPPNHRFVPVSVSGVTAPDGVSVTITITGITQDEPLNGDKDGNTCPDADGVGTDTALVRAERGGLGDGRVYHISFRADDNQGDECEGSVTVCVPNMRAPDGCVDQGGLFDATGPCDSTCSGTCEVTSNLETVGNVSCVDEAIPAGVSKRIASAHRLLTRLGDMPRIGASSRLMARASRIIRKARDLTAKAQARDAISPSCAHAAGDALDRASTLANQLSRNR